MTIYAVIFFGCRAQKYDFIILENNINPFYFFTDTTSLLALSFTVQYFVSFYNE